MDRLLLDMPSQDLSLFFFFNDTATTEIYTLSLHDALPISPFEASALAGQLSLRVKAEGRFGTPFSWLLTAEGLEMMTHRSEEHTSELQSRQYLVCRLLLEKKKKNQGS